MTTTARFYRECAVGVKTESSYGVDPTITEDDIILSEAPEISAEAVDVLERQVANSSISPFGHLIGSKYFDFKIPVELKGSGAAGTAPEYDALLRAASLLKGTSAGSSVIYDPYTGAAAISCAVEINKSGKLYQALGSRTNIEIEL